MKSGDFDAAQKAFGYAWEIVKDTGDIYRKAEICGNIASLAYIIRDYNSAEKWYTEAIEISSSGGDIEKKGIHTMNLANVYVKQKKYKEALELYKNARVLLKPFLWESHPTQELLDNHEKLALKYAEDSQNNIEKTDI